jgi:3-methyladenine DNA glycosylase AlkC
LLYDELTLPKHGFGLKRGVIPIYIAVVLSHDKENLVVKYKSSEVRITPDLLNEINQSPQDYSVILEDWNEDKAKYLKGLELLFAEQVSEREKSYNGFAFVLLAMNRWYMNLPKYAKELDKIYEGDDKFTCIDTPKKKFINSLKQLDSNPREYLLEKVFEIFGKQDVLANIVPLIREIKAEWDDTVSNLMRALISDVRKLFTSTDKRGSLASVIKDWRESLSESTMRHLFSGNENRILDLMATSSNDELAFIQRLAKAVTSLRIEDWNTDTIKSFNLDLKKFKKTVEDYDLNKLSVNNGSHDAYKITYVDISGNEVTKTFGKTEYSSKAKLLLQELASAIEEMGQAITEQEKRQVLMELLQKLC